MEVESVTPVTSRPMGQTEKLFYGMRNFGGANACVIAELRGGFSTQKMTDALKRVVARHALLRCNVTVREGGEPHLELHDHTDVPLVVVEGGGSDVVEELISAALETDYYSRPWLWELTCVLDRTDPKRFWMILCVNHSLTDGTHISHMLHNVLVAYTDPNALRDGALNSIEPTLESYQTYRVKFKDQWSFWAPQLKKLFYRVEDMKPEGRADFGVRKTGTEFRQFDEDFTSRLRKKARANQTTVNAALTAAILFAMAKRIDEERRLRISLDTNVSFRKEFGVPAEQAGPLVSILNLTFEVEPTQSFWELARACKAQLVDCQSKNLQWVANPMWASTQRWMSDATRMKFLNGEKLGRLNVGGISNVGELNIPTQLPGLRIESMRITAAQHGFGYYFANYVLSQGGRLGINLAFSEPLVSRATAQAFMGTLADALAQALAADEFSLADLKPKAAAVESVPARSGELTNVA